MNSGPRDELVVFKPFIRREDSALNKQNKI